MTDADQSLGSFRKTVFDRAPRVLSVLAFLAGALALVSAAIPSQIVTDKKQVFRVLAEAPSVALSIGGLALMVLSLGLARRLKAAWALTLLVAAHGIFATALLRPRLVELCVYIALFAVLLITRKSFFRRSSLFRMIVPRM